MMWKKPRMNDRVWIESRFTDDGSQPNGKITMILFDDEGEHEQYRIEFEDGAVEFFDATIFDYRWTDKHGGMWLCSNI